MKEAMGELNMTVVTIIAIAAIATFFTVFLWPNIRDNINNNWNNIGNTNPDEQPGAGAGGYIVK